MTVLKYDSSLNGAFDMVLKGMVRAQDEVLYSLSQDEYTIEDSYAIFDASVVFQGHSDHWDATLFVKNIADEHLRDIRSKINDLRKMEKSLRDLSSRCSGEDVPECPIIEVLQS